MFQVGGCQIEQPQSTLGGLFENALGMLFTFYQKIKRTCILLMFFHFLFLFSHAKVFSLGILRTVFFFTAL
jgi:hypothetical protein